MTSDLRTLENALSFWRLSSDEDDAVDDAVIAIAAAGDKLETTHIALIREEALIEAQLALESSPGRTPLSELRDRHSDVCRLDYVRLGTLARLIAAAVEDGRVRRFTRSRVVKLVADAVSAGRIDANELAKKARRQVDKARPA